MINSRLFLMVLILFTLVALFGTTGCEDDDTARLSSNHAGWQIPDCRSCHTNAHNANKVPGECAACHGTNGASPGHGELDGCDGCHESDIARHGDAEQFPLSSCTNCHP